MSYILDALKKSDQERQSQAGPTLQTIHRPNRGGRSRLWAAVSATVIVTTGVVVAVAYFWLPAGVKLEAAAVQSSAQGATESIPANSAANSAGESQSVAVKPAEVATPSVSLSVGPTVAFSELPDNIRNDIPALTFSFHVYSPSPASRTIIINKRRVKEGDEVMQGLHLTEITPEGVVLDWQGHSFFINVVENW